MVSSVHFTDSPGPSQYREKLRSAAKEFEKMWVETMLKNATQKMSADGETESKAISDLCQDMLPPCLAKQIVETNSLGIARKICTLLEKGTLSRS